MQKEGDQNYVATILCLFSGEMQYGILVAEINPANLALFYLISRQIGNMLRMYQMSKEQRRMQQKLEALVREVREKNEVLNFLSESDALTRISQPQRFYGESSTDEQGKCRKRDADSVCGSGSSERNQ